MGPIKMKTRLLLSVAVCVVTLNAFATVFRDTTDRQLLDRSDAVVVALVRDAAAHARPDGSIVTDYHLIVEETLKGRAAATITVTELGGRVGDRLTFVADGASYAPGERVIAFVKRRADGSYFTTSMTLGKFVLGGGMAVRSSEELGRETRQADAFVRFIREPQNLLPAAEGAAQRRMRGTAAPIKIAPNGNAKNYALLSGTTPVRWFGCDVSCSVPFEVHGSMSYSTSPGIAAGLASWTNDAGSNITLASAGSSVSATPNEDGHNVIYLGFTGSFVGVCDGALGCTIGNAGATHTFDGDTWASIFDADIVIASTVPASQFTALMTHELGHAIGIRHSDEPGRTPSSNSAIMQSSVPAIFGSTLQQWDKDAVDSLYGNGPVCVPPSISSTSGGGTVTAGAPATLTVTATGTATLNYQWYAGSFPSTISPVGTNSSTYQTPPVNSVQSYWVKVQNGCGNDSSSTITVQPAACTKPTILVQPQSQTINSGATADLQVGHDGSSPFTYQWYEGNATNTTKPVSGANQRTFKTPALTQTTSYWVRITNCNGTNSVDSVTAIITIPGTCAKPSIDRQPSAITLESGKINYLIGGATNVKSYQWYQGSVGTTTTPIAGSTPSNSRFVTQLYVDLLGRVADAGASTFVNALTGGASRASVAQAILASDEYRSKLITSYYNRFLNRAPSAAEVSYWLPAFTAGLTDEQIASQFIASPEYFFIAGSTNSGWINRVYNNVLGRNPSASEEATWLALLGTSARATVGQAILTSNEARTRLVQGWYVQYLRRAGDPAAVSAFVSLLAGGASDETVQTAIVGSDEYFNFPTIAVVGPLTQNTSFWLQAINDCGTSNSSGVTVSASCALPSISAHPADVTINIGEAPHVSVVATGATSYQWYRGGTGDPSSPIAGATGPVLETPIVLAGISQFWVKATNSCGSANSNTVRVTSLCVPPTLTISAPPSITSDTAYRVTWNGNSEVNQRYDVQEATKADFSDAVTIGSPTTASISIPAKTGLTADTRFYYRVRALPFCGGIGEYSSAASTLVTAPLPPTTTTISGANLPCAASPCSITQRYFIPGFPPTGNAVPDTFTVTSDKPFVTVSPSSGTLPPEGITVIVTVDTSLLDVGSSEATLTVTRTPGAAGKEGNAVASSSTVPVSVSIVVPVSSKPKDTNPSVNTLIIPAVAHADGANARFQSDVRITNTASGPITYQLNYTPTATDGTLTGKSAVITVNAGETKALNDIVKDWYGAGAAGEGGIGTLEIRPSNYSGKIGSVNVSFATVASSRTYAVASSGTFGQFIPAIPITAFLAKSDVSKISLQQIAHGTAYRTNLGFVEGGGQNVDLQLTLYNAAGTVLQQVPLSLKPFEHQQASLTNFFPNASLSDGRVDVQVVSDGGKVTAYASVLDNKTTDPLLVFPVDPSKISTTTVVVPGIAEVNPTEPNNFHSDMRVFNGGSAPVDVTLAFPANSALTPKTLTLAAGEVRVIDNVLPSIWGATGAGAVVISTESNASIVATARTFSRRTDGGTFGQFIPGVSAQDGTGLNERALQVVQLEQSPNFRSNLGLVEVTGNPVTVQLDGYAPESKIAAHKIVDLQPYQFVQLNGVFTQMGFPNVYNGRVAVTVISGSGRVAAYGSVIDNRTQDPTYVPAQ